MHGDCMELMQKIPSASVDLILCDLPYGMTDCSWDIEIPPYKLWAQYNRIIKETGVIALFGIQPFMSKVILSNAKNYRYNWYWMKNGTTGFTFSKYQPLRKIEEIAVFYQKGGQYYPQGIRKIENPKWTKGVPLTITDFLPSVTIVCMLGNMLLISSVLIFTCSSKDIFSIISPYV